MTPTQPHYPFKTKVTALECRWGTFNTFPYGEHILYVEHAREVIFQLNLLSVTSGILNNRLSEP